MSNEKEDGVCENKLCNDLDIKCSISNRLTQRIISSNSASSVSVCANCGKEGSGVNNSCNKCKQVKYCNAACKKQHRHKHKKQCEEYVRRADERAAELHYEKLFEQPPQLHRDCPICFIRLPLLYTGRRYYECCGKEICTGCWYAPVYDNQGTKIDEMKCPFCRTPIPKSHEEAIERYNIRMEVGDAQAIYNLGIYYRDGRQGLQQDYTKTLELLHRSAELGYAEAYNSIGCAYDIGEGAKVDKKKAMYYYELAAMEGDVNARHNLGNDELNAGNYDRALKHYMIAINGGFNGSVDQIKEMYLHGDATRDDYTKALRIYQTYLGEIKSDQRDKAAAVHEEYHYY